MILFKINSKTLSRNPSSIEQGKLKIHQSDRTINGTLVIDLIAMKNKVTVFWNYMPDADLRLLLNEINNTSFPIIEYTDPKTETPDFLKSMTADVSDISYMPHYDATTQSILWKDVKVDYIER
jgi:hypothetical protein